VHYRGEKVASVRGAWRRMLDDLELPREREWMPYLLRRSLATELRGRGVDPWDLAGFMGHRVVATTEIYTGGGLYPTVASALHLVHGELASAVGDALTPR
jgi:site-specific recombinase XerD